MTSRKRSTMVLVALAGVLASFALLAGPAGAEQSGTALADDTSVASGNATAIDGSTASGDAVATGGSTASGCSEAHNESTASGGAEPCPLAHKHAGPARPHGIPADELALTGSSTGPMMAAAAVALVLGGLLVAATSERFRHVSS